MAPTITDTIAAGSVERDARGGDSTNGLDYHALNAMLNLYGANGEIQFEMDVACSPSVLLAARQPEHRVLPQPRREAGLPRRGKLLRARGSRSVLTYFREVPDRSRVRQEVPLPTFLGAFKYYTSYTLKTFDGKRYLERFEDRVCMVALTLAAGNEDLAVELVDEIIAGRFQPATPTFLNSGKKQRGEPVSCFLLRIEDNMESIGRSINSALQLSKRGGGVACCSPTFVSTAPRSRRSRTRVRVSSRS